MYKSISFTLCSLIAAFALLKRFYLSGVAYDAPIIVNLMYENFLSLNFINWEGGFEGSYFKTHTPLIMNLISWISYIQPLNAVEYCSVVFGLFLGLLGYVSYNIFNKAFTFYGLAAVFFAILYSFNFYNVNTLYLVHFEIFYIVLLCTFFYYFSQKQYNTSYVFLFFLLISREDFGFHLFNIILATIILQRSLSRELLRKLITVGIVSCFSSILLCYFKSFFPGDQAFSRIYFEPTLQGLLEVLQPTHLFAGLVKAVAKNIYSLVNIVVLSLFSIYTRTTYMMIPVVAVMPWIGIHVISKSEYINVLPDYYGFPLAIMLIWPALTVLLFRPESQLQRKLKYLQIVLLVIGVGYSVPFFNKSFPPPTLENVRNMHIFVEQMKNHSTNNIVVTRDVATLNPRIYHSQDICPSIKKDVTQYLYFAQDYNAYEQVMRYVYRYKINGTPIRILSTKILDGGEYENLVENEDFWLEALSYSKEYMYKTLTKPLVLEFHKEKKLKKKLIHLSVGRYCGELEMVESNEYEFRVLNQANQVSYTTTENKFCFNIMQAQDYYITILPKNHTQRLLLHKLNIRYYG